MASGNFGGGYGTINDPFLVEDVADLRAIGNRLNRHFKQVRDIDLSSYPIWLPIGFDRQEENAGTIHYRPFTGSFNGNGYSIKNMFVKHERSHKNRGGPGIVGLFAGLTFAHVYNVSIEGGVLDALDSKIGLIAVFSNSSTRIENCRIKDMNIESYACHIGGLVYFVANGSTITDCTVEDFTIRHITNFQTIDGYRYYPTAIGGLVGYISSDGPDYLQTVIERCAVINLRMEGRYSNPSHGQRGGLIGTYSGTPQTVVKDCYVKGSFYEYTPEISSIGGLVGNLYFEAKIENCYAAIETEIIWEDPWTEELLSLDYGGLVGEIISSDTPFHEQIVNCYFDSDKFDTADYDKRGGRSTSQMKHRSTFNDWDFDSVWFIREGLDYPFLRERVITKNYGQCKGIPFPLNMRKMNTV